MSSTDQQMHAVLLELMMLSHGSTQSWNASGRGGERDSRPPGESYPPAEAYRDRYAAASHDVARQRVLHDARDELETWRGHGIRRHAGESGQQQEQRMLREGRGFDPQTVAIRFDTNAGRVRKLRVSNGCLPETGEPLPGAPVTPIAGPDRVLELHGQGCTLRQITTLTGVSKSQVHRILGRVA